MEEKEVKTYFEEIKKEQKKKLTDAGFTETQAEVLLEIIETKAMSGGLF